MDGKVMKKTQDTLGKIIKKPPLTEKLLSKPPFRFLHDVMTSLIKTTGFMKGLFTESELNSENVKEKESKMAFLQKVIDFTSSVTGKSVSAKPSKIVAGHEPEQTNALLQSLAAAVNMKGDYDAQVSKFLNKGSKEEPAKEKSKDREEKRRKEPEEKRDREKSRDRERGREKEEKKEKDDRKDKSRDRDERHKDREDRHREKDDRHNKDREERHRDRDDRHKDRDRRKKHRDDDDEGKENEGMVNGEKQESEVQRPVRPSSAKGSRRRRDGRHRDSSDEEDEQHQRAPTQKAPPPSEPMGEDDQSPQVSASKKLNRPSSARPAPPRRKQETIENEPAMRLGSGKPANVIVDGGDSDDDENFLVEESAPPPPEPDQTISRPEDSDEDDHGGLVKKILETKKELEGGSQQQQQTRKTEVERPTMSDGQRRKQREMVQKEIDRLRGSIQTLTRSANPLGKIMDYVQEDLDSMQKELERWKTENKEHILALKREKAITDKAIEPMKAQLGEVDQAIADQMDLIAAVKSNIIRNDQKIEKLLRSIAKS
ncbi:TRAF3-interacting protein 1-like isoform X3 [Mizuhopecten yessoensis]|uniref:TRAF3-interacting protein 1 n=1 Tax=Mizuhopecten yessoensis TaxID=6573 RepID=A0A1B0VW26_MIZYE|nr:TRAF3-interacting protein 1-like isoform X3 [Mizuhopecten yessoensis]ANA56767.1 TRAF3IP1 [Mizuhopecten yessoensis]AOR16718.1 TRAF3IP1 [Mizuhopecten yessoensis]OWF43692.1 TRAF3-interacting protein 1 [Mizuhopecten yessoensis]